MDKAFYGLCFNHSGDRLFASGGANDKILCWQFASGSATPLAPIFLPKATSKGKIFPAGLDITEDGQTLFVAGQLDGYLQEISLPKGTIVNKNKIGAYPYAVLVSDRWNKVFVSLWGESRIAICDRNNRGSLCVTSAKGLSSKANPNGPNPNKADDLQTQHIGGLFQGILSFIPIPDEAQLAVFTKQVEKNNGYNASAEKGRPHEKTARRRAIPRYTGEPSLIEHVIYIIKENRTYDQVFGDLPQGDGEANLCLFGRDVTPNQHALAEMFVLLDHTLYDTASMLRTMELILGLLPMSQFDAAAFPMVPMFCEDANVTPFTALSSRVPLNEVNTALAYGAIESQAMDFSKEDAAPEIRLNEIIWKSVRGEKSEMPRPISRRSRGVEEGDGD